MLYTFSQAHYSETELQRYLTEITENDAVVLWQDGRVVGCEVWGNVYSMQRAMFCVGAGYFSPKI